MAADDILRDAYAAPGKGGLAPHREAIWQLRVKGWSWRDIAQFLTERGIPTDHAAVYRFFTRTGSPMTIPTKAQYVDALTTMTPRVTAAQRLMLHAHYRAPNRSITYTELAHAAGFEGGHQGANLQYGFLGKAIGEHVAPAFVFPPAEQRAEDLFYSGTLGMKNQWPRGAEFELVMHHELAEALRLLDEQGWFDQSRLDRA